MRFCSECRDRERKFWHKRYAWKPTNINGYTIWFEFYWRRFHPWSAFDGEWEYSVNLPIQRGNVVPFRKVS